MFRMKNPVHPGAFVRSEVLEPLGLGVGDAAKVLGVKRQTLSNLLNGHAKLSEEMAIRIGKAFRWPADDLLAMQHAYDLAHLSEREARIDVQPYKGLAT